MPAEDVALLPLENRLRGRRRGCTKSISCATPRITRHGHGAFAEVGADKDVVFVIREPEALGLRQHKTVRHKLAHLEVELADHVRMPDRRGID